MNAIQWKEPALSWNGKVAEDGRAAILEIRSDDFIPNSLAMTGTNPAAYHNDHRLEPKSAGTSLKLYQPLHGRYYFVSHFLVCRQVGLPTRPSTGPTANLYSSSFAAARPPAKRHESRWTRAATGSLCKARRS